MFNGDVFDFFSSCGQKFINDVKNTLDRQRGV